MEPQINILMLCICSRNYITIRQGNNVDVINRSGKIVQTTAYYPYGEPTIEPSGQRFLYGGKEREHGAGRNTYDFSARSLIAPLGQWCVPDRKAESFYPLSIYSYCGGDPINYVDPDGNEITIIEESDGDKVQRLKLRISGVVYNASSGECDLEKLTKAIESQLNEVFNFSVDGIKVTMEADIRVAKSEKDIALNDHIFAVVDQNQLKKGVLGRTSGLGIELSTQLIDQTLTGHNTRTIAHEVGHSMGLHDINLSRNALPIEYDGINLMTQIRALDKNIDKNSAIFLELPQILNIVENYNSGRLNRMSNIQLKYKLPLLNKLLFKNK